MTKAEELWRKYQHDGWIGPTAFSAAMREYGAAVRKRDAEVCRKSTITDMRTDDWRVEEMWEAINETVEETAAAIEQEPLP